MNIKLNANAANIHSSLGNGSLGLLALTITFTVYVTLLNIAFGTPDDLKWVSINPAEATGTQNTQLEETHTKETCIWRKYLATSKVLKQQLLQAVNNMHFCAL